MSSEPWLRIKDFEEVYTQSIVCILMKVAAADSSTLRRCSCRGPQCLKTDIRCRDLQHHAHLCWTCPQVCSEHNMTENLVTKCRLLDLAKSSSGSPKSSYRHCRNLKQAILLKSCHGNIDVPPWPTVVTGRFMGMSESSCRYHCRLGFLVGRSAPHPFRCHSKDEQ